MEKRRKQVRHLILLPRSSEGRDELTARSALQKRQQELLRQREMAKEAAAYKVSVCSCIRLAPGLTLTPACPHAVQLKYEQANREKARAAEPPGWSASEPFSRRCAPPFWPSSASPSRGCRETVLLLSRGCRETVLLPGLDCRRRVTPDQRSWHCRFGSATPTTSTRCSICRCSTSGPSPQTTSYETRVSTSSGSGTRTVRAATTSARSASTKPSNDLRQVRCLMLAVLHEAGPVRLMTPVLLPFREPSDGLSGPGDVTQTQPGRS
jgi:hypothetical protein